MLDNPSQKYLATLYFPRTAPGRLAVSQPLPDRVAEKIRFHSTIDGLEFHFVENLELWLSPKKPGVQTSREEGLYTVLLKEPGSTTFWLFTTSDPDRFQDNVRSWGSNAAEMVARLRARNPITDHAEFVTKHREIMTELERQQEEKRQQDQAKKDQDLKAQKERHAQTMEDAAKKFLDGEELDAERFRDLLKFHGLWEAIHPRTKSYLLNRLGWVKSNGVYAYWPVKGRKATSSQISHLATRLSAHLMAHAAL